MHTVYLGLGSNLNGPVAQLAQATDAIAALPGVTLLKSSPNYRNAPLLKAAPQNTEDKLTSPEEQPDYVNKVLVIATHLSPQDLLAELQVIEVQQGRPRDHAHWAPRTIDIDILLYDELTLHTQKLTLPHPGLTSRMFVVLPLLAIAPELRLPNGECLASYRDQFKNKSELWVEL